MKPFVLRIVPVGLVLVAFLGMPLISVAQPSSDQQRVNLDRRDLVSSEQINRNGLRLEVGGKPVEVTSLRLARNPSQTCHLHVPKFVQLLGRDSGFQQALRQAETRAIVETKIRLESKVVFDRLGNPEIVCEGPGNSCVATVVVVTNLEGLFEGPGGGRPQPQLR